MSIQSLSANHATFVPNDDLRANAHGVCKRMGCAAATVTLVASAALLSLVALVVIGLFVNPLAGIIVAGALFLGCLIIPWFCSSNSERTIHFPINTAGHQSPPIIYYPYANILGGSPPSAPPITPVRIYTQQTSRPHPPITPVPIYSPPSATYPSRTQGQHMGRGPTPSSPPAAINPSQTQGQHMGRGHLRD